MTTAASARRTSEDVWKVLQELSPISEKFTIAAAFSNVHGVTKFLARPKMWTMIIGSRRWRRKDERGHWRAHWEGIKNSVKSRSATFRP